VTPTPFHPAGATSTPPVRIVVGLRGGTKTFSFSGSATRSSYMEAVHRESAPSNFDMTTGKVTS
jgi:hypothetical protein